MTDKVKTNILKIHNESRNQQAIGKVNKNFASGSNIATMQWDDALAQFAELNVRQCVMKHDACVNSGN